MSEHREREGWADALRVFAFFLAAFYHFYLYVGFPNRAQMGLPMLFADWGRSLTLACNALFTMLSGFLLSDKPFKKGYFRTLPRLLLAYVLAAAVSIPVRHFLLGDTATLLEWLQRFFGFRGVYYGWYVEMYVGLLLLSPLLSAGLNALPEKRLPAVCLCCLLATSLPGLLRGFPLPDYWKAAYPLTGFVFGASLRRLRPRVPLWLTVPGTAVLSFLMGLTTWLSTDQTLSEGWSWEFGSVPALALALLVFLSFLRLSPGRRLSSVLRFFSGGVYGAYLLSNLTDRFVYDLVHAWRAPEKYSLQFFCFFLPALLWNLLAGRALCRLSGLIKRKGRRAPPALRG